ncbi:hypothetical protein PI124_g16277 [Phytophthora idaei]|nr:hypothetical protein PI124_g16277 [Phytophthora idaei]
MKISKNVAFLALASLAVTSIADASVAGNGPVVRKLGGVSSTTTTSPPTSKDSYTTQQNTSTTSSPSSDSTASATSDSITQQTSTSPTTSTTPSMTTTDSTTLGSQTSTTDGHTSPAPAPTDAERRHPSDYRTFISEKALRVLGKAPSALKSMIYAGGTVISKQCPRLHALSMQNLSRHVEAPPPLRYSRL